MELLVNILNLITFAFILMGLLLSVKILWGMPLSFDFIQLFGCMTQGLAFTLAMFIIAGIVLFGNKLINDRQAALSAASSSEEDRIAATTREAIAQSEADANLATAQVIATQEALTRNLAGTETARAAAAETTAQAAVTRLAEMERTVTAVLATSTLIPTPTLTAQVIVTQEALTHLAGTETAGATATAEAEATRAAATRAAEGTSTAIAVSATSTLTPTPFPLLPAVNIDDEETDIDRSRLPANDSFRLIRWEPWFTNEEIPDDWFYMIRFLPSNDRDAVFLVTSVTQEEAVENQQNGWLTYSFDIETLPPDNRGCYPYWDVIVVIEADKISSCPIEPSSDGLCRLTEFSEQRALGTARPGACTPNVNPNDGTRGGSNPDSGPGTSPI